MQASRIPQAIALLAVVVGALSWSQPDMIGADIWWHLASGRITWELGEIPLVDSFSHTALGQPWINHEWLWGWLAWPAYRVAPDLVAWLNLALIGVTFALVALMAQRASRSWFVAGAVTWLAAATCHWFLDIRPHLVTLSFSVLVMATREWRWAPWLWPPLIALWANLHGGFIFGLGLIGLHLLITTARARLRPELRPAVESGWLGFVAAAIAAGLNPWGFTIYGIPLQTLDTRTPFRDLIEWHSPALSLDPRTYAGRFGWMLLATLPGILHVRRAPFQVAVVFVTAIMAFGARRFIPLFALTAAPVAALGLAPAWQMVRQRLPARERAGPTFAAATVALAVTLLLWHEVRLVPRPLQRWTGEESLPSGAAAYLESLPQPPKRLFHFYNWGGYLELHAPSTPVFIDGRAGTVYRDELARDYQVLYSAARGWSDRLAAHQVDAVLVETGSPLARVLRRQRPPWRLAHVDPRSVLLFPPGSDVPEMSVTSSFPGDAVDEKLSLGFRARMSGDLAAAEKFLIDAVTRDPLQLHAYGELMLVAARKGDPEAIHHWIAAALEAYPRRQDQIWAFAEYAWLLAGEPRERLAALENLREGSPFIREDLLEESQRRLQDARERVSAEAID